MAVRHHFENQKLPFIVNGSTNHHDLRC